MPRPAGAAICGPMKKFLTPLFLAALFALFGTGCNNTASITAGLKVELTSIGRTADGGTQVSWRVVNPNVVPYLLAKSTHRIQLNGVLIGTLADNEALAVPAQTSLDRRHPLVVAGPAAERILAAATDSTPYKMESVVTIRLYGDEVEKIQLTASGTVPVTAK